VTSGETAAVAVHALARGVAVGVLGYFPAAAPDGLGAAFQSDVSRARATLTVAIAVAIGALTIGWWIGPVAAAGLVVAAAIAIVATRTLGGITGDVAGAVEQAVELAALLPASALAAHPHLWWR